MRIIAHAFLCTQMIVYKKQNTFTFDYTPLKMKMKSICTNFCLFIPLADINRLLSFIISCSVVWSLNLNYKFILYESNLVLAYLCTLAFMHCNTLILHRKALNMKEKRHLHQFLGFYPPADFNRWLNFIMNCSVLSGN